MTNFVSMESRPECKLLQKTLGLFRIVFATPDDVGVHKMASTIPSP